jgi:hypothetical protein
MREAHSSVEKADCAFGSAFAVDSSGGAAQLLSLGGSRIMFQIHTKLSVSEAREAMIRLADDSSRASGKIDGDTFRLHPKPRRRGTPVTFYGRFLSDRDGTLIRVWSVPHWAIVIFFPIWVWFGRQQVHAPWWFVILGLVACIASFIFETRRGYDLLRQTYAA